jgi:hypothetical protein
MKIKILDSTTIEITESLEWTGARPANKKQIRQSDIMKLFNETHGGFIVESVSGPGKISNFRGQEESKGLWVVKVKPKKEAVKKEAVKKEAVKATAPKKTTKSKQAKGKEG